MHLVHVVREIIKKIVPYTILSYFSKIRHHFTSKPAAHLKDVFGFDIYQNTNDILYYEKYVGKTINKKLNDDFSVIDSINYSFVDLNYSKAYLRHLFICKESLGRQIATLHNLAFYLWLVREARKQIINGSFQKWKKITVKRMNNRM